MLIKAGEKIHVIMRRMFKGQVRKHFAGEVLTADGARVRACGHVFVYDDRTAKYVRKNTKRTTILDLASSGYIVNVIPSDVHLDDGRYETLDRSELYFTDGKDFRLNVNEFSATR